VEDNLHSEFSKFDDFLNKVLNNSINPGHVYDTVYEALINNTSYAVYGGYPKNIKLKALDSLIKWYELTEEYEKCNKIKKIKSQL
tara:strand:+ start:8814 stop:9068 length:255 start_codon:yes stop_codon:yes gene_type:complete